MFRIGIFAVWYIIGFICCVINNFYVDKADVKLGEIFLFLFIAALGPLVLSVSFVEFIARRIYKTPKNSSTSIWGKPVILKSWFVKGYDPENRKD